jgi:hypothetical protein
METAISKPPTMDWTNDPNILERFKEWRKEISLKAEMMKEDKKTPAYICLYILNHLGKEGLKIAEQAEQAK